jgi:PAS domain S-box-containing protein
LNGVYPDDSCQVLWEDGDRVFRRGWRLGDDGKRSAVLVVTPAAEHPPPSILDRLAHEYELKDALDAAWAARPLALSREGGRTALLLEDPGGEPLERLIGAPMEIGRFLRLAVALSATLGRLHQRGLIHKDIKPANVLVNSATGQVWLMGFGIASRLPRERQAPAPPEVIAGTLAYMAPEQTGRMNRSIDFRSDLYALGVTLYEMLTGELPFTASDPMEWVHCHVARQPPPPDERVAGIPGPLSAIVMKLLAKTAEDRYQTAAGLAVDLRKCLAEWESNRGIEPIRLGADDASDRLMAPEKLYGREHEIETLLGVFDRVVTDGATELVLVSGYAGIGKSSLVNELQKALVPPHGLFASGKFDQYKRDIPYATLAQAFRSLVRPLIGESEVELVRWRESLSEALGPNGQLIVNLVPELELVIGKQPPVADLPPQDAKNRFQMVFRRFLGVFAREKHPLALFLDDLQWLDAATLDLLEHSVAHADVRRLLLVGAYRDNEVGPAHPLMRTLEAIRDAGAKVHEIVLSPLRIDDVERLVADALHCKPPRARPLAQLVHEKTRGNPFFAIQFLTALNEEGLLVFDPVTPAWRWDIDRIRARSYTDNVADLLVEKMKRLSARTQDAMKQLACLGNVVDVPTLTLVHEETEEAVHAALWDALYAGLVLRQESVYAFLHDRIQQAAYSLIPEERRSDVHLRIGRALLASMTADQLAEHLLDVANQFNRAAGRLIDRDEKAQVATINLRAGRRAKASAAYASAHAFFSAGMALLDEGDWGSQYTLTFSLWLERAECEFLTGNFETAEQLIAALLQRAASKVDQAAAYHLKIQLHIVRSENPQAVDSALTCLRLFGIDIPAHPTWEQVQAEYETVWEGLDGRPIESLIYLPPMPDPELQAAMRVLAVLSVSAFFTDFHLYCLTACRKANVGIQHGVSEASPLGFALFGMILGPAFHRYSEGYRFAKLACDLADKHGFIAFRAQVYNAMAVAAFWTEPIGTVIDLEWATFRAAIEAGDLTFACFSMEIRITGFLLRNDPLDAVWRESEKGLDFVRKAQFHDIAALVACQQRFIATMQGRTATLSSFSDAEFDEAAFEAQLAGRTPTTTCLYWILKLKARFLLGDYSEALAAADKAKALLWAATAHVQRPDYFYYAALMVAALYENAIADEQTGWRELLTAHQEQLREWATNYPPTFADKYELVSAEIARLEGRAFDAMQLYEQAIRSARENGFVQNEALAREVAARFYAARGFEKIAHLYLRDARHCYLQWGAHGKVKQLDERYPHLQEERVPTSRAATIGAPVAQLDLETAVKASQAVSGEIILENLIKTLMVIAVEHAGAERGLLILPRADQLWVEAEATTGRKIVEVNLRRAPVTPSELPLSILQYVIRTQEPVISDDAFREKPFSADEYVTSTHVRSVLCLPLIKQTKLVGMLYLENNVAAAVFTPARLSLLKLLASQAAISLENSRLYRDLEDREGKIRRLVDSNIIGVFVGDFDGRILEANDAFLRIVGYDREDLAAARINWKDLTPPDWGERDAQWVEEHKRTGVRLPIEKEYLRKDGSRVPILLGSATFEEGGSQSVTFVLDLTERKRAEERLRVQHTVAQILAEAVTIEDASPRILLAMGECLGWDVGALWRVDRKAEALRCVELWHKASIEIPEFERVSRKSTFVPGLGLPGRVWSSLEPEYVPDVVSDQNFPRGPIAEREEIHAALAFPILLGEEALGVIEFFSREIRQPDLELLNVLATIGSQIGQFIERKRAEQALRESEAKFRAAIDGIAGLVAIMAPSGELESVNRPIIEYFGRSVEELKNWGTGDAVHPEDLPRVLESYRTSLAAGTPFHHELRLRRFDGEYRWFENRGAPITDESGRITRWYCLLVDIDDRTRALERLQQMQSDLAHMNRLSMMGELAASLAHEITQPIASARNNARAALNFLDRQPPELGEVLEALGCVVGDADRAGDIVDRMRDHIKKAPPRKHRFDLNEAINEVIVLARSAIAKNGISVQTRLTEGLAPVEGDRVQLQQVVLNLILNAAEAMSAVDERARELLISTEQSRTNGVLVAVRDSGPGIDPEDIERVFDAFYTTKSSGVGMGLSICRSIIDAHGGRLWADVNAPRGAVFQFTLPGVDKELEPGHHGRLDSPLSRNSVQ